MVTSLLDVKLSTNAIDWMDNSLINRLSIDNWSDELEMNSMVRLKEGLSNICRQKLELLQISTNIWDPTLTKTCS